MMRDQSGERINFMLSMRCHSMKSVTLGAMRRCRKTGSVSTVETARDLRNQLFS
jgi:hypothetical protein